MWKVFLAIIPEWMWLLHTCTYFFISFLSSLSKKNKTGFPLSFHSVSFVPNSLFESKRQSEEKLRSEWEINVWFLYCFIFLNGTVNLVGVINTVILLYIMCRFLWIYKDGNMGNSDKWEELTTLNWPKAFVNRQKSEFAYTRKAFKGWNMTSLSEIKLYEKMQKCVPYRQYTLYPPPLF